MYDWVTASGKAAHIGFKLCKDPLPPTMSQVTHAAESTTMSEVDRQEAWNTDPNEVGVWLKNSLWLLIAATVLWGKIGGIKNWYGFT